MGGTAPSFDAVVDLAIAAASGVASSQVNRIRSRYPAAPPSQVVRILERRYTVAVSGAGGAVGAVAAVPGVGSGAALALTTGQAGAFLASSATLALAVADVHGVQIEDLARRRTLVLASLLGERGSVLVERELGLGTAFWARSLLTRLPLSTVSRVNRALRRHAARTTSAGGAGLLLGRLTPFGIGALVGVAGAHAMGKTVTTGVARAFGPAPGTFADQGTPQAAEPPTSLGGER